MASEPALPLSPHANVLVLAAGRSGGEDSVAKLQNKSHKCLVEIAGKVMLERVIEVLIESGAFAGIYISIENEEVIRSVPRLAEWLDQGRIAVAKSRGNLADSVLAAASEISQPYPLIVTTGDNALHTPEMIRDFMAMFRAGDADVAVAFASETAVRKEFPDVGLAYHRLKDGGFSACNLYGVRRERGLHTVRVFKSGGQFGKRHLRILKAFGIMPFLLYKLKLVTLDQLLQRIGRNFGVSIDTIILPHGFAAIDVDNPRFYAISERALRAREDTGGPSPDTALEKGGPQP